MQCICHHDHLNNKPMIYLPAQHQQPVLAITFRFSRVLKSSIPLVQEGLLKRAKKGMSLSKRAWLVAVSVGAVEALKDQGFCRWNYTIRSLHQRAKIHAGSMSLAKKLPSQSSAAVSKARSQGKMNQAEESLRKVMYLSCWGPN